MEITSSNSRKILSFTSLSGKQSRRSETSSPPVWHPQPPTLVLVKQASNSCTSNASSATLVLVSKSSPPVWHPQPPTLVLKYLTVGTAISNFDSTCRREILPVTLRRRPQQQLARYTSRRLAYDKPLGGAFQAAPPPYLGTRNRQRRRHRLLSIYVYMYVGTAFLSLSTHTQVLSLSLHTGTFSLSTHKELILPRD